MQRGLHLIHMECNHRCGLALFAACWFAHGLHGQGKHKGPACCHYVQLSVLAQYGYSLRADIFST